MTIISLTDKERARFASWLEQEAESNKAMIQQMNKMVGFPNDALLGMLQRETAAALVMAAKLRNIEDQMI